ncbi:MAG TPA: glycosyltransferase 87 family protein [Acidobacteriaceae bacterium]|nr:glycosyltransferase 87 family protein [Acidobacteriaceae bacterium]
MSSPHEVMSQPISGQAAHSVPRASMPVWIRIVPAIGACLVLVCLRVRTVRWPLPLHDFMTYWIAGKLFLTGANPYSTTGMFAVERSLGWQSAPLVLLNPPWALPFVALLAALPFNIAHCLWWGLSLILEVVCLTALWKYFGGEAGKQWIAVFLALTFLPAGTAELMGQITPLMLAALTAFLLLLRRRRDILAGFCLIGVGFKPHLLYLVLLAIILWTVQSRRWKIAVATASTYAVATLGTIAFNHNVLDYLHNTQQAALDTACGVGGELRSLFGVQLVWLQFLPTLVGIVWFAFYWRKHRKTWIWEQRIPTLLLVSIATSPYCWAHDYILTLPAFVSLAVGLSKTRTNWFAPSICYLTVQIVIFSPHHTKAGLATLSLLWLLFYWGVDHFFCRNQTTGSAASSPLTAPAYRSQASPAAQS